MASRLKRAAALALAALTFGGAAAASADPSMAGGRHGGGWHGGGWGWQRAGGWGWAGPAAAAGFAAGLAAGAIAGPPYIYRPGAYSGGCYWQNRPFYDAWGNFIGYRAVQFCY